MVRQRAVEGEGNVEDVSQHGRRASMAIHPALIDTRLEHLHPWKEVEKLRRCHVVEQAWIAMSLVKSIGDEKVMLVGMALISQTKADLLSGSVASRSIRGCYRRNIPVW